MARAFEDGVERLVSWSVHHRRRVLAVSVLAALVALPGVFQLEVHNRMTEWVDPEDDRAGAFLEGVASLEGLVNFERTMLVDASGHPEGVMSPDSLRDQERLADFVAGEVPEITGTFGPVRFVQLAHYELQRARGDSPTEARLPASDVELRLAIDAAMEHQAGAINYTTTPGYHTGFLGFTFESPPFTMEATDVGRRITAAVVTAHATLDLASLEPAYEEPVGVASVTAHVDDLLSRELFLFGALGLLLVFALFWVASGRIVAVLGGFTSLGIGLVLTVGILGWTGVPFNILNLAILPLIMGNGIDYSIHVLAEAGTDRRHFGKGLGRHLGRALGVPIVLVTLTTAVGLGSLALGSSPYLRQMGILSAASISLIAFLSLTYLPAFLATFPPGLRRQKKRSRLAWSPFLAAGRMGRRHPVALWGIVGLLSLGGAWGFATMDYEVDLLSGSLPRDDPVIVNQVVFESLFQTEDAWFLMMGGEILTIESFAFQDRFRAAAIDAGVAGGPDGFYDLPALARGHHAMRQSPGGLLDPVLDPAAPDPPPDEQVKGLESDPAYEALLRPLLSQDHQFGALYILPAPDSKRVADTDARLAALQQAVRDANPPPDLDVQVYSFKMLARDFMGESQDSLQVLYVVSLASTLLLFWSVTRDVRATAIVALPVLLSSLWWFGLLRLSLGSIGVYQLISLVFITSIGSDYAAYLVYKHRDTGDWAGTLRTTGRAVLFSALTDAGAFWIFSQTSVRSGGQMLLGAALAVVAILAATLAVVPTLLEKRRTPVPNKHPLNPAEAEVPQGTPPSIT